MGGHSILIALLGLSVSCAPALKISRGHPLGEKVRKIAVFPFDNFEGEEGTGSMVASLFAREWSERESQREILDPDTVERLLAAKYVTVPRPPDRFAGAELGSIVGADTVLLGAVVEYGAVRRPKLRAVIQEPAVGISATLVRVEDGAILWSGYLARTSGAVILPARATVKDVAQSAVRALVDDLEAAGKAALHGAR